MGIYDRDYYRDEPRNWWGSPSEKRGVMALIVLLVAGMIGYYAHSTVVQEVGNNPDRGYSTSTLRLYAAFDFQAIKRGEVWRILTSPFISEFSLFLIFFGLLGLYTFGGEMETIYGTPRFVLFFLSAGVLGNIAKLLLAMAGIGTEAITYGPSAMIFATFVLFACHYPQRPISLLLVTVPIWLLVVVYLGINLLMVFRVEESNQAKAYFVDPLLGAAFGFIFYRSRGALLDLPASLGRLRATKSRSAPQLRLADEPADNRDGDDNFGSTESPIPAAMRTPVDEHLEAKLDAVLAKVAKHGKASLNPEEQSILMRASEVFKKRRS